MASLRELQTIFENALGSVTGVNITLGDRTAVTTDVQKPAADISGGVSTSLNDNESFTVYITNTAGTSTDVTINLSPNGGTDQYEIDESPVAVGAGEDATVELTYDADHIELAGNNTNALKVQTREVI